MNKNLKKNLNVPNFLTLLRFFMVGVMVWFFLNNHPVYAMYIYLLAVFTDFLDGFIARKFNLVTDIGKLFDPLADKLLQVAAVYCMYRVGYLPLVAFILVIVNEFIMVYGASFLLFRKHIVVSANKYGKIAAGLFYGAILSTFLHDYTAPYDVYAIFLSIAFMYLSLLQYWYVQVRNRKKKENESIKG